MTSVVVEPAGKAGGLLGTLAFCLAPAHFISKLLLCCSSCSQEHVPSFALLVPRCSICTFDLYTYFRGAGMN